MFMGASCKKNKPQKTELEKLPPVTQTGANTFGCLINGKAFTPKGYSGTGTPNPKIIFDIGLDGLPYLQIETQQFNINRDPEGYVLLSFGKITGAGTYNFPAFNFSIGWEKVLKECFTPAFDSSLKKIEIFKQSILSIVSGQ